MKKIRFRITLIIFFNLGWTIAYGQCYVSNYDVVQERICLDGSKFSFELIDPLDPHKYVKGDYIKRGDTLVFSAGVTQTGLKVLKFNVADDNREGKYLRLIDQNNNGLAFVTIVVSGKYGQTDEKGFMALGEEFPTEVDLSITMLSKEVWPNPYQKQYYSIKLNYAKDKGNLLIVQLDLTREFKKSFEHETKLLAKDDKLFYLRHNKTLMDLYFKME